MSFRVCLCGAESTGKSTLAPRLAAHFGGVVVREYGRTWAEAHGTEFRRQDLRTIADGQIATRLGAEMDAPRLIVEDTDIVMTCAWSVMVFGSADPALAAIPATGDMYLLFTPETAWVDDGTRLFGGASRAQFHATIVAELARRAIVPVVISGDWDARFAAAVAAVGTVLDSSGRRQRRRLS